MRKVLTSLLPGVILVSGLATVADAAGRPDYNYVQARYINQDLDSGCTQDGLSFSGSMVLNDQMLIEGSYSDVSGNGCASDYLKLGVGIRSDYGTASSLFGVVQLLTFDAGADTDVGVGVKGGIRSFIDEGIEVSAYAAYESVDEFEQIYLGLSGAYWVNPSFAVVGNFNITDESDQEIGIGVRFAY